jgi:hypothetical protein
VAQEKEKKKTDYDCDCPYDACDAAAAADDDSACIQMVLDLEVELDFVLEDMVLELELEPADLRPDLDSAWAWRKQDLDHGKKELGIDSAWMTWGRQGLDRDCVDLDADVADLDDYADIGVHVHGYVHMDAAAADARAHGVHVHDYAGDEDDVHD